MAKREGTTASMAQTSEGKGNPASMAQLRGSKNINENASTSESGRKLLHRARMDALLKQALARPVTVVVAGTGYGKSTAVYSFLRVSGARTIWVQLSEKDNMPSHFWETVSQAVLSLNPRLAAELFAVGFPTTEELRQHLVGLTVNDIGTRYSYVLVFDDLHLITSKPVLEHIAWVASIAREILSVIAISKHDILLGALELQQAGRLSRIGEAELSLTKRELAEYFELMGLPISSELLAEIFSETEGWPFAVSFAARLLENHPDNHDRAHIRTALKGNFSAIIDSELFSVLSKELRHFLVRFSLVKHLSPELVQEFSGGPAAMEELAARSSLIRVYLQTGKFDYITEALAQLETLTNETTFDNQFVLYELITSWFYAMIGEFGNVEPWLKSDMWSSFEHAVFDGINDTVKAKYYYISKQYETLLTFINSRSEHFGILRYALGKVELGAIKAVCLMQLGKRAEALVAFKAAYDLTHPSGIDMPFIELGSPMRSLARLALKETASETSVWDAVAEARGALKATKPKLGIPVEWLIMIQSKAATYAKRLSYVRSRYQDAHNPETSIPLTTKELDILDDLSQGLSRSEISVAHGVSINTIKTMLPLIYQKLGADNALDAIRRATARKLL